MDDIVSIPSPNVVQRPINFTECGSPPIFRVRYCGHQHSFGNNTILLHNKEAITLKPYEATTVYFDVIVFTSLPATSILYGSPIMYHQGLTCIINLIPTNDQYLHVTIVNKKTHTVEFEPDALTFYCNTVLN
jgi:hypothetical protein